MKAAGRWAAMLTGLALLSPAGATLSAAPAAPPLRFGPAVRVSSETSEAWEPSLLVDRFGNIFVTARRARSNLVAALDERSATMSRSMSWLWASSDGGRTFGNLPGYPLDAQNHEWGYEGDFALDGKDHLYFVDQTYADSTITRWTVSGRGAYAMDLHRPFLPTAQPVDDRPFLAARGDGRVFTVVNATTALLNPFGREGGDAYGEGRFSAYRSTDGAATFEPVGRSLNDSGACRPATDPRPDSPYVYIACTNDGGAHGLLDEAAARGTLWAFVSADDGATYERFRVGEYDGTAETYDWPLVAVGPNGDAWVLHVDADETEPQDDGSVRIVTNRLNLYHSSDRGRTWSQRDITPARGRYRWGTLIVSPEGKVAFAIQHRPNEQAPWNAYASVFGPDEKPVLVPIDPSNPVDAASSAEPPSELMGLAFEPGGSLLAVWTRVESFNGLEFMRVYMARAAAPAAVKGEKRARPGPAKRPGSTHPQRPARPLPATGVDDPGSAVLLAFLAMLALRCRRTAGTRERSRSTS